MGFFDGILRLAGRRPPAAGRAGRDTPPDALAARYAALLDAAFSAVVVTDQHGRIHEFNRAAEAMFGLPAAQALGQPVTTLMPERHRAEPWGTPDGPRPGERQRGVGRRADGGEFPLEVAVAVWEGDGERLTTTIIADLSPVAAAQHQREESAVLLRAVLASITDPVFVKDRHRRFLIANQATADNFATTADALIGKTTAELGLAPWAADNAAIDRRVIERGEVVSYQETLSAGARVRRLETSKYPLRSEGGTIVGMVGVARDVTAQQEAMRAQHESEERLSLALDAAGAGSWEYDIATNTTRWSDSCRALYGVNAAVEPSFQGWLDCLHPDDLPEVRAEIARVLETGSATFHIEYRLRPQHGRVRWLSSLGRVYTAADGRPARIVGLNFDITARKEGEWALRAAKEQAEQAVLAKTKFLAAASHDLRQPVQSLYMFTGALRGEIADGPALETLGQMEQTVDALKGLLDGLLDVSRLDAGIVRPQLGVLRLADLLRELGDTFGPLASRKGLTLTLPSTAAAVTSDRTLLMRMLFNLVENAVHYTEHGGIEIACADSGGRLRVEVRDTGIGIPPDHIRRVWDEFHQVGNPERDRSQGLGLGLAIVRRLAILLDHPVEVSSQPGRGSVFTVALPVAAVAAPPPAPREAPRQPPRSDAHTVLVIDDDPMVLTALRKFLTRRGFAVLAASGIAEAVEQACRAPERVSALLADYRLRDTETGTVAIAAVRQALGRPVPAAVLTGETGGDCLAEAEARNLPVIHKPIAPGPLFETLIAMVAEPPAADVA